MKTVQLIIVLMITVFSIHLHAQDCEYNTNEGYFPIDENVPIQPTTNTFNRFMGTNFVKGDPIDRLRCVGFVREYHEWSAVEEENLYYPCNNYLWNPSSANVNVASYDDMYRDMEALGLDICATMTRNIPQIHDECGYSTHLESQPAIMVDNDCNTPISCTADGTLPKDYIWHADFIWQFNERYRTEFAHQANRHKSNPPTNEEEGLP